MMTIREALKALHVARRSSPLGLDTVLCVSIPDVEYLHVEEIVVELSNDGDGAIVRIDVDETPFGVPGEG